MISYKNYTFNYIIQGHKEFGSRKMK